jgi:hypothetical protein
MPSVISANVQFRELVLTPKINVPLEVINGQVNILSKPVPPQMTIWEISKA